MQQVTHENPSPRIRKDYISSQHRITSHLTMSGITDSAATQAHDIVEQAEAEEQRVSCPIVF